ncbi:MAG: flagellar protein [Anaerolineae bacterium]|nr:flagellar protein [Anaerolineae bacterium]
MVDKVTGISPSIKPPAGLEAGKGRAERPDRSAGPNFAEVLQTQTDQALRFSAHAQERLRSREIQLSEQDTATLTQAVEMASAKGAKESLILLDDLALVVSVRNKVVITALERGEQKSNVFTHIDSAILVHRSNAKSA